MLIDEKLGREVARSEGLAIIGVVGVVVAAKQKGLLPAVGELLVRLENEAGFRLRLAVKMAALQAEGQAEA